MPFLSDCMTGLDAVDSPACEHSQIRTRLWLKTAERTQILQSDIRRISPFDEGVALE